jgi:hypothetical protein
MYIDFHPYFISQAYSKMNLILQLVLDIVLQTHNITMLNI